MSHWEFSKVVKTMVKPISKKALGIIGKILEPELTVMSMGQRPQQIWFTMITWTLKEIQ